MQQPLGQGKSLLCYQDGFGISSPLPTLLPGEFSRTLIPGMQPLFSEMDDFAEEGIKYYLGPLENVVVSLQHADFGKWEVLVKVRRILWEINQDYTPKHT